MLLLSNCKDKRKKKEKLLLQSSMNVGTTIVLSILADGKFRVTNSDLLTDNCSEQFERVNLKHVMQLLGSKD